MGRNKKRFTPISTKTLGIESDYNWTIWDNKEQKDLYHEWVFKSKRDCLEVCKKMY